MTPGLKGVVKMVDDIGQIHVSWENGSGLALNIEEDSFRVEQSQEAENVQKAGGGQEEVQAQGIGMQME